MAMVPRVLCNRFFDSLTTFCSATSLFEIGIEAAALNHEALHDTMEQGALVMLTLYITEKIFNGLGRLCPRRAEARCRQRWSQSLPWGSPSWLAAATWAQWPDHC